VTAAKKTVQVCGRLPVLKVTVQHLHSAASRMCHLNGTVRVCVTNRTGIQSRPRLKLALTYFGLHPYIALVSTVVMDYLIYQPCMDGRLSWPIWLTSGGQLTHIVITCQVSTIDRVQVRESPSVKRPTPKPPSYAMLLGTFVCTCSAGLCGALVSRCIRQFAGSPKVSPALPLVKSDQLSTREEIG